jgi:hypothetical protein
MFFRNAEIRNRKDDIAPVLRGKQRSQIAKLALCGMLLSGCQAEQAPSHAPTSAVLKSDASTEAGAVVRLIDAVTKQPREGTTTINMPLVSLQKSRYEDAYMTLSSAARPEAQASYLRGFYALQVQFSPDLSKPADQQDELADVQSVEIEAYVLQPGSQQSYLYSSEFDLHKLRGRRTWTVTLAENSLSGINEYARLYGSRRDLVSVRGSARDKHDVVLTSSTMQSVIDNDEQILRGIAADKPVPRDLQNIPLPRTYYGDAQIVI